ncbi:MAG TPA: 50S ribosomal protein L29 [Amoebophilaceae bacterium]|jgi:large subunit ribosomal protein L29|nr:50S ribosomal protein L29 [Amoebophilaceae bacterium]
MKYKEIQLLSLEEHSDKLQEEIDYLIKLRFAHAVTPIENPMKIRSSRRLIARLKTAQAGYKHKQPSEA